MTNTAFSLERGNETLKFDDDGRPKRTGTLLTASAHTITAVIGSGVLSLAWATAQLGWIGGIGALVAFAIITWFTSVLLSDCYRTPDPITGTRNYKYIDCVRATLGEDKVKLCGLAQYSSLVGTTIGYTITTAISMAAIKRSNCHDGGCLSEGKPFIMMYGALQIILCQIPNFHKIHYLSIIAAIMSFAYSSIGLGLAVEKIAEGVHVETSLTGTQVGKDLSSMDKMWNIFAAVGNIAFAYSFALVHIEIQDTLKSSPPENKVMKQASLTGISVTSVFYILCGVTGYAAFGNDAPGNFLTGFGSYEPFWIVDFANICIVIHLVGAYQVFCQPFFAFVESWSSKKWPNSSFINGEKVITLPNGSHFTISLFRLVWRTAYVIFTTMVALVFPFFNDFMGLLGAITFWPITIYYPVEMYIVRKKIPKHSLVWISLKTLSMICLIISLASAAGSAQGLIMSL